MRIHSTAFCLLVSFCVLSCSSAPPPGGSTRDAQPIAGRTGEGTDAISGFDASWAQDPLWDDGQAEVALYEANRPQYGRVEPYEAVFIVVKEEFNGRLFVKADAPYEGKRVFPVMKLNALHSYWTQNYPYHYLLSVFVRRDDPTNLVKLTLGGQEWCGNTFNEIKYGGPRPELVFHSYFDGQGDGTRPLDLRRNDLVEDQLPLALRSLKFEPGLRLSVRILPSLMANRLRETSKLVPANLTVDGEEEVEPGLGTHTAWKVSLEKGEIVQPWWFEKAAPHILLKMESSDGRAWTLKDRTRKPYWREPTFHPKM